jgi:hypothetical protein
MLDESTIEIASLKKLSSIGNISEYFPTIIPRVLELAQAFECLLESTTLA